MADDREPSGAQKAFGDFAPALVGLTDDVLFGQVWTRRELPPKERSLITVAALTTSGNTDQLVYHLGLAKQNGRHRSQGRRPRLLRPLGGSEGLGTVASVSDEG